MERIVKITESAFYTTNKIYDLCRYFRDKGFTKVKIIKDINIIDLQTVNEK